MKIEDSIVTIKTVDGEEHAFPVEKIRKLTTYYNKDNDLTTYCLSYEPNFLSIPFVGEIDISEKDFNEIKHYLDNCEFVKTAETDIETNIDYTFKKQ